QFKLIVKEALKFLRSTLPSTIEIRETYDNDIGVIDADPTQMHQVLMNLCTNAGYAMEQNGGILAVSLRNVDCGLRTAEYENVAPNLQPGRYLELTVKDTGYGITPEIREKIFEPYFTTKEKDGGTGIGLSVVHGIVTQHGGTITVESEPGNGSTFHVYLPLSQGAEEPQAAKEETPLPKGDERILFVDDEASLAKLGKQMLKALGYHVTSATSGTEALAVFRDRPNQFDLVMTDTNMPHMPGDMLVRELMKIRPDIPVVIYTGLSKRMSKEKAKEMGIKAFVMKPLSMKILGETVREVLDGTRDMKNWNKRLKN
ncbi:MAG: response regulator, partial [Deltaproteobacteria bacterium]|nr:response regulator [Deltaproteobacteria bacterium]